MVGRLNDTRLLENLVKSEKEYHAALVNLLALSHSSIASLAGYGSALSPESSQAVLGVSECLKAVDDGLRGYAESIDDWREKLGEIKRLDVDIENAVRDREILVTRLIKISKQKPKGSQTNLGKSGSKLSQAQTELQACEAHLTAKQRELDEITRSAIKDGLEKRCHALETCGLIWTDKGREGLKVLQALSKESDGPMPSQHPPYSNLSRPYFGKLANGSTSPRSTTDSNTSLAPSQSASQIAANPNASARPSEDTHITSALSQPIVPAPLPILVGSSPTKGNFTTNIPTPQNVAVSNNINTISLNSPHQPDMPTHPQPLFHDRGEPELRPVAEGDTDGDAPEGEDLGSSDSGSEDDGPMEVHENPARVAVPIAATVAPAVVMESRADQSNQVTGRMGKTESPVLYPAVNDNSHVHLDDKAAVNEGRETRVTTMDEDRTPTASPVRSKVSNLLHRPEPATGSRRIAPAVQQSARRESPSPPRKRSGSGSFFNGIKSFFNPGKSGSTRTASSSRSHANQRDASPPPVPRLNDAAVGGGGGWKTRADKNLKEGKNEMIVGSARGAISSGADSSSDDGNTRRNKRKNGGGSQFIMRNNNVGGNDRDVMGNPVTGPALTGGGGMFDAGAPLSRRPTRKKQQSASDAAGLGIEAEGGAVHRNVSRRSSDGALPGPSRTNSTATTKGNAASTRRTNNNIVAEPGTTSVKETIPTQAPPVPRKNPLRSNSSEIATRRAASGGGKIRKRGPAKQFDDGLGSAGGALLVGPQEPKPVTSAMASGNESFGGMGLPDAAVSRATSTVRSTAAGAASGGRGHQRKASEELEPVKPVMMTSGTTSNMTSVPPQRGNGGSGAGVSRNNSMASRTSSGNGRTRGGGNNLMSIIEAPSGGIGSNRTASPPTMLEVVRAPGSVTGPQAPILSLPSSSSMPSLPPQVPTKESSRQIPSGPPKLVLPSEIRGGAIPTSTSTTSLPAVNSALRQHESLPATRSRQEKHNSVPSALAPPPLRSALRTRSPSPDPSSLASHPPPTNALASVTAPLSIFAAAAVTATAPARADNVNDDAASMSSYETGHEVMDEPVSHAYEHAAGHGLMVPMVDGPLLPKQGGTDLSVSVSTDSTTQPRRRKSVRMALPPSATSTPAVTPAALERAEANSYMGHVIGVPTAPSHEVKIPTPNHNGGSERRSRLVERAPRDVWDEEDSDAGGDYGEARKALQRATEDLASAGRKKRAGAEA
ncbi:hypothetical protein FRB95_006783 [Tulasnella sp. JGI-2019a]|nr:hypothetical protein FRB95_006783 [Tulasnella sp. JGI-2019a]